MPEIIKSCEQGSPEWFDLRLASIGGTAINLIAPGGKGYKKTLYEFLGEYLTGVKAETFKFKHADRGHEFEAPARKLYQMITRKKVEQVALIKSDRSHRHYSPDGLIENGMIEIKVRIPSVWFALSEGELEPIADRRQRQWGLYISQLDWVDSINYCPELADKGRESMLIKRVERDDKMIKELQRAADVFISDLWELIRKYGG